MRDTVAQHLNALSDDRCRDVLHSCCGSRRWVRHMLALRPYPDDETLFRRAGTTWWDLDPADWLEAFAHHPRIGARGTKGWAEQEQAGMAGAGTDTRDALVEANRAYEQRFGHIFLICATGRSGEEILTALYHRLRNDPGTELRLAAGEQAKITELRLRKLVDS